MPGVGRGASQGSSSSVSPRLRRPLRDGLSRGLGLTAAAAAVDGGVATAYYFLHTGIIVYCDC